MSCRFLRCVRVPWTVASIGLLFPLCMDLPRTVIERLTLDFPSRNGRNPSALLGAADFLESQLVSLGLTVESMRYSDGTLDVRNLIIHRPGALPGASHFVIGAHYDTVLGTPGADDNASGVAGVVELARRFARLSTRHPLSFVLFPHEEPPYFLSSAMGSRRYASALSAADIPVRMMLSLEMIGFAHDESAQRYPFPLMRTLGGYPRQGNFIGIVGNLRSMRTVRSLRRAMQAACPIQVESLNAPGFLPPLFLSDHSSFWQFGFPAAMVTDTAFLRNPHYHMPTDTIGTLNFDFLAHVIDALEVGILSLDAEKEV